MKRNELQLLLVVIGILAAIASWQLVYKTYDEKTAVIEEENVVLKERLDRLEILNGRKDQYIADTEEMKTESQEIVSKFPAGVRTEDMIMYLYNMELADVNEVAVTTLTMNDPLPVIYAGELEVDGYTLADEGIGMFDTQSTVGFKTTYNGLKNVVRYIYGLPNRKAITQVSLAVTDNGYLSGTMNLEFYNLVGVDTNYVETNIPGVPLGKFNFFGVISGTSAQFQAEEGEESTEEEGAEGEEGEETEDEIE